MSAHLLGLGFKAVMGCRTRKLVLMKLIDHCHDDGTRIFPAIETVAVAAESSKRTVQRKIDEFLSVGLLKLVRQGGKGRGSTNEYALDIDMLMALARDGWDAVMAARAEKADILDVDVKGDTVTPLNDPANGDTSAAKGDISALKGDTRCHPTPQLEPLKNPQEREGARGEAEQDANDQHLDVDQPSDGGEGGSRLDDRENPKRAAFKERVQRFCSGRGYTTGEWPRWDRVTFDYHFRHFAALTPDERADAERWRDPYLADKARKREPVKISPGNFFRDRFWGALDPAILARAEQVASAGGKPGDLPKPEGHAPAHGPVWMAYAFAALLDGPDDPDAAEHADQTRAHFGRAWPKLAQMETMAGLRRSVSFGAWAHRLKDAMEPVPVGSERLADWRAAFATRHWPERIFGPMDVVYLPAGGPDALDAFNARLAEARTASPPRPVAPSPPPDPASAAAGGKRDHASAPSGRSPAGEAGAPGDPSQIEDIPL